MEDAQIVLERHEQRIRALERDISDLKAVQTEIRTMNETLVTLATELKHTNEHLARHEQKIDAIATSPAGTVVPHSVQSSRLSFQRARILRSPSVYWTPHMPCGRSIEGRS